MQFRVVAGRMPFLQESNTLLDESVLGEIRLCRGGKSCPWGRGWFSHGGAGLPRFTGWGACPDPRQAGGTTAAAVRAAGDNNLIAKNFRLFHIGERRGFCFPGFFRAQVNAALCEVVPHSHNPCPHSQADTERFTTPQLINLILFRIRFLSCMRERYLLGVEEFR